MATKKKPTKKPKAGAPEKGRGGVAGKRYEPTPEQYELVAVALERGIPVERVRKFILNPATGKQISKVTFARHFIEQIEDGSISLISLALKTIAAEMRSHGDKAITAAIFTLKTRAGWSEKTILELHKDDPLDRLTLADQARIVSTAQKSLDQNREARKRLGIPSIDDEPEGHA